MFPILKHSNYGIIFFNVLSVGIFCAYYKTALNTVPKIIATNITVLSCFQQLFVNTSYRKTY